VYDVIVGINLLREGLDLPEVSLVCILDADKEGYLRSGGSLIQTIGRAARHVNGRVIMYADKVTFSMQHALTETERRRRIQSEYNRAHGIEPEGIVKAIRDITDNLRNKVAEDKSVYNAGGLPKDELTRMVIELEKQMKTAAKNLEFEKAAGLRDQVIELRKALVSDVDALTELASVAGREGEVPFSDNAARRRDREVTYRPQRRGARYRR
jgi:excinuclease ABC subunit B